MPHLTSFQHFEHIVDTLKDVNDVDPQVWDLLKDFANKLDDPWHVVNLVGRKNVVPLFDYAMSLLRQPPEGLNALVMEQSLQQAGVPPTSVLWAQLGLVRMRLGTRVPL